MSLSHQRRQGDGTVDGQQLDELRKLNKSELFKLASEFAGGFSLTPVTKSWKIGYTNLPVNDLSFGGRFFGEFRLSFSHMSRATTNNDNAIYGQLRDKGLEVALISTYNRSDGSSRGNSAHSTYLGFAESMHVNTYPDNENAAVSMTVSFIGYQLGIIDPNPLGIIKKWSNSTVILGDSIETNDYGIGWVSQVATALGVVPNNLSISGAGMNRMLRAYYNAYGIGLNHVVSSMVGFNNLRLPSEVGKTEHIEFTLAAYRSLLVSFFSKSISFPYDGVVGGDQWSGVIANGFVSADGDAELVNYNSRSKFFRVNPDRAGCNLATKSVLVGNEEISKSLAGRYFALGTYGVAADLDYSRIEIYVNESLYTTYNPNGRAYVGTAEGLGFDKIVNDAVVIDAGFEGFHVIKLKFLDAGKKTVVDYLSTLKSPVEASANGQFSVQIGDYANCSNEPDIGYNYVGYETLKSVVDEANQSRKDMVLSLFNGYPVYFPQTNKYYNPLVSNGQVVADGIHPSTSGAAKIAQAHLEIINS